MILSRHRLQSNKLILLREDCKYIGVLFPLSRNSQRKIDTACYTSDTKNRKLLHCVVYLHFTPRRKTQRDPLCSSARIFAQPPKWVSLYAARRRKKRRREEAAISRIAAGICVRLIYSRHNFIGRRTYIHFVSIENHGR